MITSPFASLAEKIRVKQYQQGWTVEVEKKTWYGKKYWAPFIYLNSDSYVPNYSSTITNAVEAAIAAMRRDILYNELPLHHTR